MLSGTLYRSRTTHNTIFAGLFILLEFALTLPCSTTEAFFVVLATLTAILREYTRSSVGTNST